MKSNAYVTDLLNLEFCNLAMAGLGDVTGPRGSSVAGSYYFALHTASPGAGGDQTASECSYTGYTRIGVVRSTGGFTVAGSSVTPVANVQFPARVDSGTQVATFWSIGDASSGAGKIRRFGAIGSAPRPFSCEAATDTFQIPAHGLSVNDQIVFWTVTDQVLPSGVTDGVIYFVKTAPDADTFTIAATQGGATIDITVSGAGRFQKVSGFTITQNVVPILLNTTTIEDA